MDSSHGGVSLVAPCLRHGDTSSLVLARVMHLAQLRCALRCGAAPQLSPLNVPPWLVIDKCGLGMVVGCVGVIAI